MKVSDIDLRGIKEFCRSDFEALYKEIVSSMLLAICASLNFVVGVISSAALRSEANGELDSALQGSLCSIAPLLASFIKTRGHFFRINW